MRITHRIYSLWLKYRIKFSQRPPSYVSKDGDDLPTVVVTWPPSRRCSAFTLAASEELIIHKANIAWPTSEQHWLTSRGSAQFGQSVSIKQAQLGKVNFQLKQLLQMKSTLALSSLVFLGGAYAHTIFQVRSFAHIPDFNVLRTGNRNSG